MVTRNSAAQARWRFWTSLAWAVSTIALAGCAEQPPAREPSVPTRAQAPSAPTPPPNPTSAPLREQPDPADIAAAQQAARDEIRECAGPADPTGKAVARVAFTANGHVTGGAISGLPLEGTEAAACAIRALRDMRVMPFSGAPVAVTFEVVVDRPPPRPPPPPPPAVTVLGTGRVPPEVIQKVIRDRFPSYRACYEEGLRRDFTLQGLVTVRFDIELDGKVARASARASDLPDVRVRACVRKAFEALSFPAPEGGIVTVTYPIMFSMAR